MTSNSLLPGLDIKKAPAPGKDFSNTLYIFYQFDFSNDPPVPLIGFIRVGGSAYV
jgi:hypothetical protein